MKVVSWHVWFVPRPTTRVVCSCVVLHGDFKYLWSNPLGIPKCLRLVLETFVAPLLKSDDPCFKWSENEFCFYADVHHSQFFLRPLGSVNVCEDLNSSLRIHPNCFFIFMPCLHRLYLVCVKRLYRLPFFSGGLSRIEVPSCSTVEDNVLHFIPPLWLRMVLLVLFVMGNFFPFCRTVSFGILWVLRAARILTFP